MTSVKTYGKKRNSKGHAKGGEMKADPLQEFRLAYQKDRLNAEFKRKSTNDASKATKLQKSEQSKEDSELKSFEESLNKLQPKSLSPNQLKNFNIDFDPEAALSSDENYEEDIEFVEKDLNANRVRPAHEVIEEGISKGYPEKINYRAIRKFARRNIEHARNVLKRESKSEFYDRAKRRISKSPLTQVTQTTAIASDWIPQPGYYSQRGWETVSMVLQKELTDEVQKIMKRKPWSKMTQSIIYFDMVLVPELMVKLYQKEQSINRADAVKLLEESSEYGRLKFRDVIEDDSGYSDYEDEFEIAERQQVLEKPKTAAEKDSKTRKVIEFIDDDDDDAIVRAKSAPKRRKTDGGGSKKSSDNDQGNIIAVVKRQKTAETSKPKSSKVVFQELFLNDDEDAGDESIADEFD